MHPLDNNTLRTSYTSKRMGSAKNTWNTYKYEKLWVDETAKGRQRVDNFDNIMPSKSTREKRSTGRLNFGEKSNGVGRSLTELEEEFIYAAEFGDIPTVQRILQDNTNFNIDYNDILGRTPLRLAVGNEHLEVVELLLDRCNSTTIHEALLQAISAGHENIAETILKHPKYKDIKRENKRFGETDYFYNQTSEDSPFSSDITPLILAAERNQFEIVQLLLLRGDTIQKPHHYYCACQECNNKLQFDQLRLAKTRLNAYRGLASGAYISLSSKDPVLTAFELAQELRDVARVEKYFKNDYLSLADQLSQYVVKLLDKVRGHDELEILLNKSGQSSEDETYELLSRLKMAIQFNEKKFVAHPSCQQKLVSIWYSNFRTLERSNWITRIMIMTLVTTTYPILAIVYWFAPKSKLQKILRCPCIKFIGHTMMFVVFLIMIIISTFTELPDAKKSLLYKIPKANSSYQYFRNITSSPYPKDFVIRTYEPEIIHILISIWIVGMLWQEMKQVYAAGIHNYFDSLYNYLDFAVLTLYITSFTLRYLSIIKVRISLEYFASNDSWTLLFNKDKTAESYWYWLLADRCYWIALDPHNIAESLFAIANVISFTRVSYVLPANEHFGPMQISLGKMIGDIIKFAVIISVVIFAFMVGLYNLYWYYSIRKIVEIRDHNVKPQAEKFFGNLDNTFRTVFWSLFGKGEASVVELDGFSHYFTRNVGYWIFGAYNISTVIVLLNMLIAMMTRSFECIQTEADTEWKFARSKLYMEYIQEDCTLPVPFNIIPSFKSIFYILRFFYRLFVKKEESGMVRHPGRIKDVELYAMPSGRRQGITQLDASAWETDSPHLKGIKHFQERMSTTNGFVRNDSDPSICSQKLTYQRVMKRIVKRYIFDMQRENDTNEGDFDELKQDISSFRYEMLNHISTHQNDKKVNQEQISQLRSRVDELVRQNDIILSLLQRESGKKRMTDLDACFDSSDNSTLDIYGGNINESTSAHESVQDLSDMSTSQHLSDESRSEKQDSFDKADPNGKEETHIHVDVELDKDDTPNDGKDDISL
ncbi:short transient receptor potential channel 3 [Octopus sinensis]|uniref:Short transient receptor potential channel 3 n=1 Tax=Octopus sinensis TaxID=2607531 RepID=A0A6P7SQP6_9MOLL|nr:short transient receptor potential channel 3 [Octopus sinensis]